MIAMKMRDRRTDRKVSGSRSSESVRRTDRQTDSRQKGEGRGRGGTNGCCGRGNSSFGGFLLMLVPVRR